MVGTATGIERHVPVDPTNKAVIQPANKIPSVAIEWTVGRMLFLVLLRGPELAPVGGLGAPEPIILKS